MRFTMIASALALLAASAPAQHTVVFALETGFPTLDNAGGLLVAGQIVEDELAMVTPGAGLYSASVFQSVGAQWCFLGDADGDGRLVDASLAAPGADIDEVFIKRFPSAPTGVLGPRDVFVSKEDATDMAPGFEDGDVVRYATQGPVEVFLTEAMLLAAIGQLPTADVDLDALCQNEFGDLFVSFDVDEVVTNAGGIGSGTMGDGGIAMIPAASITYDGSANVSAISVGSAMIVANETDMSAMMLASGMATSVGGVPSTSSFDVGALEIDPNGGTWISPVTGASLPNLFFAWLGFSNDGAILSTAGGGTFAVINGVPMASASATTGLQLGLLPDSTGIFGLSGLALIPARPPVLAIENDPVNLITSSTILFTRQEVSGATPNGLVLFFFDFGPIGVGGFLPTTPFPGFGGELFGVGLPTLLGFALADGKGYASRVHFLPPSAVGSMMNLAFQAFDVGQMSFATPAGLQFL